MAKTVKISRRRRSSAKRMVKKNRGAIGKKSKVARRNRISRKRHHKMKGGASWIDDAAMDNTTGVRSNLSMVWNSLFYERAKDILKGKFINHDNYINQTVSETNLKTKVLFVIDMQNDFIDRKYTRMGNGDVNPVTGEVFDYGNFDVADGRKMLEKDSLFLNFIESALSKDSPYKTVVFTRDYHPVGHSSFTGAFKKSPNLLCGDCSSESINTTLYSGNFPAHCVQGFEGSKLVNEIEDLIKTAKYTNDTSTEIKILFKGMHKNIDSFTAFPKDDIDTISSNPTHQICRSCSSITGGYMLKYRDEPASLATCFMFNQKVDPNDKSMTQTVSELSSSSENNIIRVLEDKTNKLDEFQLFVKEDYGWLNDERIDTIEVCGLAGDYCVRDTVVALSKKYLNKKIVLLNDFTRYPALPFYTIDLLAQHKPESKYSSDAYTKDDSLASLKDEEIQEFINNQLNGLPDNDKSDKMKVLSAYAKWAPESGTVNKDIIYYLLEKNLETGVRTLIDKDALKSIDTKDLITMEDVPRYINPLKYHHFITPLESFIEDYRPENIQIVMSWVDKLGVNRVANEEPVTEP